MDRAPGWQAAGFVQPSLKVAWAALGLIHFHLGSLDSRVWIFSACCREPLRTLLLSGSDWPQSSKALFLSQTVHICRQQRQRGITLGLRGLELEAWHLTSEKTRTRAAKDISECPWELGMGWGCELRIPGFIVVSSLLLLFQSCIHICLNSFPLYKLIWYVHRLQSLTAR